MNVKSSILQHRPPHMLISTPACLSRPVGGGAAAGQEVLRGAEREERGERAKRRAAPVRGGVVARTLLLRRVRPRCRLVEAKALDMAAVRTVVLDEVDSLLLPHSRQVRVPPLRRPSTARGCPNPSTGR